MHRSRRPALAALVAGLMVLGAGCSGADPAPQAAPGAESGTAAPAAPGAAAGVAWIDTVCGSLLDLITSVRGLKPDTTDFRGYSAFIGSYIGIIDKAVKTAQDAGPAPVAGGDAMLKGLVDPLVDYRAKLVASKAVVDKADANDPASVSAAATALQVLKSPPAFNVPSTPELASATSAAPKCQQLDQLRKQAATPSPAPSGG